MTRSPENIMKQLHVEGKTGEHFHFVQKQLLPRVHRPCLPSFPRRAREHKGLLL